MMASNIYLEPALLFFFAPGFYACSMTLQPMTDQQTRVLSMSMTNLLVRAVLEGSSFSGEDISAVLPLEPGLYADQAELMLSNLHPSAELTIYGPTVALSKLEVSQCIVSRKLCDCYCKCVTVGMRRVQSTYLFLGGIYFSQHCCRREGGTQQLLKVYHQRCGPSGSALRRYFHKQHFLWPDSCHPSHFDSRG